MFTDLYFVYVYVCVGGGSCPCRFTHPSPNPYHHTHQNNKTQQEFNRLLVDLQRNLEPSNRERMGQKLTVFRVNVQQFLTI